MLTLDSCNMLEYFSKKWIGNWEFIDFCGKCIYAAYSCSMELCLNSEGDKKLQYINYFMHRINLLRFHEITPVVVFDGGNIPCKAATEHDRYRHAPSSIRFSGVFSSRLINGIS